MKKPSLRDVPVEELFWIGTSWAFRMAKASLHTKCASGLELLRYWERPSKSEGAGGNLQSGRRLFALVLISIYSACNISNQLQWQAVLIGNLLWRADLFNICFQDDVQDVVER